MFMCSMNFTKKKNIVKIDKVGNTATKSKQKLLPCIALFWPRRFAVLLSSITKQMFFKWVPPKPLLKRNWRLANAHAALFLKQKSFNLPFKIEVSLFSFGIAPLIFYLIGAPIFVFMKKKWCFPRHFHPHGTSTLMAGRKGKNWPQNVLQTTLDNLPSLVHTLL